MPAITSKAMTSATTTLWVSAALPATYDKIGFEALTWTKVSEINNIGSVGGTTSVQQHRPVDTGYVVKLAGSQDMGTAEITMAKHKDVAVTLLQTAFANRQPISVKIVYPVAMDTTSYFTGIVTTNVTTVGGSDSILELRTTIDINNEVIEIENT